MALIPGSAALAQSTSAAPSLTHGEEEILKELKAVKALVQKQQTQLDELQSKVYSILAYL
jgi:hypothetical protein